MSVGLLDGNLAPSQCADVDHLLAGRREDDVTALRSYLDRFSNSGLASARDVHGDVDAFAARVVHNLGNEVLRLSVDDVVGAELARDVEALLIVAEAGND